MFLFEVFSQRDAFQNIRQVFSSLFLYLSDEALWCVVTVWRDVVQVKTLFSRPVICNKNIQAAGTIPALALSHSQKVKQKLLLLLKC